MFLTASTGVADNQKRSTRRRPSSPQLPFRLRRATSSRDARAGEERAHRGSFGRACRRLAWDRCSREVSLVLPDDVWLTSLSADGRRSASVWSTHRRPPTAAAFSINGRTYSHDGVARLLARLAVVPQLSNVQLQHSALATSETGRKVVEFSINATVKGAGA